MDTPIEFEGRALETCIRYVEQLQRLIDASFGAVLS